MEQFKNAIKARCAQKGVTEYELYYQLEESTSVSVFQQEINEFTSSMEGGICFRCMVDGRMGYASTECLDPAEASALVDKAVDNARILETSDSEFLGEGGQEYPTLERACYPLPTTAELIESALEVQNGLYAADPRVADGTTTQCLREKNEFGIWNSKGLDLFYVNHVAGIVAAAVVSDGTENANDAKIRLGELSSIDRSALVRESVEGALEKLGGETAPTGVYPVVFSPKAMAELLQTFSGIFSAEAAQKGLSGLANKEGQQVGSAQVTIIDDPFHPDNPMPMTFDGEGSPTMCKTLVEGGILRTLLHNLKTAHKAGRPTTGNAAKAGYRSTIGVKPFTLYLAGGTLSPEELLRQAGEGVYIDALHGTHAGTNPVSGDFSIQSTGYLIQNGEKTTRIKGFTVAGNFYELLKQITAVANDTKLPMPLGRTAFGSPTVLVDRLSIAGK